MLFQAVGFRYSIDFSVVKRGHTNSCQKKYAWCGYAFNMSGEADDESSGGTREACVGRSGSETRVWRDVTDVTARPHAFSVLALATGRRHLAPSARHSPRLRPQPAHSLPRRTMLALAHPVQHDHPNIHSPPVPQQPQRQQPPSSRRSSSSASSSTSASRPSQPNVASSSSTHPSLSSSSSSHAASSAASLSSASSSTPHATQRTDHRPHPTSASGQPPPESSRPSVDIHQYPAQDLLRLLASLLTQIAAANDNLPSESPSHSHSSHHTYPNLPELQQRPIWRSLTNASRNALATPSSSLSFHARNVPTISLEAYLLRILKYCPTTNQVFLSLLVYFDRMARIATEATGRSFVIDSYNIHRLVIAGVTVASKFFSDVFYTNSRYAKVCSYVFADCPRLSCRTIASLAEKNSVHVFHM